MKWTGHTHTHTHTHIYIYIYIVRPAAWFAIECTSRHRFNQRSLGAYHIRHITWLHVVAATHLIRVYNTHDVTWNASLTGGSIRPPTQRSLAESHEVQSLAPFSFARLTSSRVWAFSTTCLSAILKCLDSVYAPLSKTRISAISWLRASHTSPACNVWSVWVQFIANIINLGLIFSTTQPIGQYYIPSVFADIALSANPHIERYLGLQLDHCRTSVSPHITTDERISQSICGRFTSIDLK